MASGIVRFLRVFFQSLPEKWPVPWVGAGYAPQTQTCRVLIGFY